MRIPGRFQSGVPSIDHVGNRTRGERPLLPLCMLMHPLLEAQWTGPPDGLDGAFKAALGEPETNARFSFALRVEVFPRVTVFP